MRAVWRYCRAVCGLMLISSQYRSKTPSPPRAVIDSSLSPMTSRFSPAVVHQSAAVAYVLLCVAHTDSSLHR
jgi:hypothetical protein